MLKISKNKFSNDVEGEAFFIINNYDVIVSIANERGVVSEETIFFEREIQKVVQTYADGLLQKHFSFLCTFIKKYAKRGDEKDEKSSSNNQQPLKITGTPTCSADSVEKILKSFAEGEYWKKVLEVVDKEIKTKIANYERGMLIFQKLLSLIFEYYSCLIDIVQLHFKDLRSNQYFLPKSEISYAMKNLTFYADK